MLNDAGEVNAHFARVVLHLCKPVLRTTHALRFWDR